ncbi:DUF421 domain-containing protein [Ramlibacter tataouinensis]|uniref:DUF421 domain-containing protein n=1 Tax=Ramlibacter tataouinensis TaxID=94132 RepID=UPI0022F38DB1|nr:YetF domain-containing protein [Ramlibacter tataouinensis]WBY00067.1 DUF421 domain-containing protein [Ramlibacter tataouinensis]
MFDMSLPWWEFIARGLVIYLALLVLVRLSGKRTVGQFTPFDLVVVLLLSEAVSNGLSGGDDSVSGGLIAAGTLIALNFTLGWLSAHFDQFEQLVEGREVLLGRNGVLYEQVLRRERVSPADVHKVLRENDCRLQQMRCAFLEADGTISIIKQ